jgi:hypothetical protein
MLNFVENLLENERDPRSGPMNDQDHSLSLSDTDRSLVLIEGLSHFLTNFLQNLASCHTALIDIYYKIIYSNEEKLFMTVNFQFLIDTVYCNE